MAKWIAGLIGRDDVAGYADEMTDARFKGGGDAGVLSKALADLQSGRSQYQRAGRRSEDARIYGRGR
ncbi:hypothetical protein [Rhizobium yanglingense]